MALAPSWHSSDWLTASPSRERWNLHSVIQLFGGLPEGLVSTCLDAWGLLTVKKWRGVTCCSIRGPAILQLTSLQLSTNKRCQTCDFPLVWRKKIQLCILNSNFSDCCQGIVICLVCFGELVGGRHDLDACGLAKTRESRALVAVAPENLQYHK